MSFKTVMEHWARNGLLNSVSFETDCSPRRPGPEIIGLIVAWDREMKQLSVDALASMANVSASTIERIERCERVSDSALRKVALALGRDEGAFTDIRVPLNAEEVVAELETTWGRIEETTTFPVQPLRSQRQLRTLADADAILVDGARLGEQARSDVADLREYLDLVSFIRAERAGFIEGGGEVKVRGLYRDVLRTAQTIERERRAISLCGTYEAEAAHNGLLSGKTVTVGVIAFFPKRTDPCASKRTVLWGPKTVRIGFLE